MTKPCGFLKSFPRSKLVSFISSFQFFLFDSQMIKPMAAMLGDDKCKVSVQSAQICPVCSRFGTSCAGSETVPG